MKPKYFDIHSHLYFPEYDTDHNDVLKRMIDSDVGTITIGTNLETSKKAIETTTWSEYIYASVGFHPADLDPKEKVSITDLKTLLEHKKVVAIGECGLDFFRLIGDEIEQKIKKDFQKQIFEEHIQLAVETKKPLMIHCRAAYPDMIDILSSKKREYGDTLRAHFHFFTESIETARKILDMGFTVSFTGVITFVSDYKELVSFVPLESMMSETDAPFVAPMPYRGKRNEPAYVMEVIQRIADIKGISKDIVSETLRNNVSRVFGV